MKRFWIRRGIGFLAFGIGIAALFGFIVMNLWNGILPAVLGVSAITFGQALGILVLSRILFGGFGRPGWGGPRHGHPFKAQWKQKMAERFEKMTPEERDAFRRKMQARCGGAGPWAKSFGKE